MGSLTIYDSPVAAVADIPDGASIMLGGFSANFGAPKALLRAPMDCNAAVDLTFIANSTPQLPPVGLGELAADEIVTPGIVAQRLVCLRSNGDA